MNFLSGYKTYIFAALVAVASGANYLGWLNHDVYLWLLGTLGAGSVASMRAALPTAK